MINQTRDAVTWEILTAFLEFLGAPALVRGRLWTARGQESSRVFIATVEVRIPIHSLRTYYP